MGRLQRRGGSGCVAHFPLNCLTKRVRKQVPAAVLLIAFLAQLSWAQGVPGDVVGAPASPRSFSSAPLNSSPSNPRGSPSPPTDGGAGSDELSLSSPMFQGILPDIPNLQGGYVFQFGGTTREGRLTLNYTLPKTVNGRDVVFAQTYARFQDLLKTLTGCPYPQVQCLLGGGYRKRLSDGVMLGGNLFFNANRLHTYWYSSGIFGMEMAAVTAGEGLASLNFNYYGNIFSQTTGLFSLFRRKPGDYRVQFAYSQPLLDRSFNLQVQASGYKLYREPVLYGWIVGAELTTSNRAVSLKYNLGYDRMNARYHVVGVAFNVGFQVSKLIAGENPFSRY
jgi:hypothetical protein